METVIIYGSEYGTTAKYAKRLGKLTNTEVKNYKEVKDLVGYQKVIYFGGLYAGNVKGLRETANRIPTDAEVMVVTVGLVDPYEKSNADRIVKNIGKQLPPVFFNHAEFFHLRGAIDYKKLSAKHRIMMGALCGMLKLKAKRKQTDDDRLIISTYGDKVDFTDFDALDRIAESIEK